MKRLVSIMMAVLLVLALAGCAAGGGAPSDGGSGGSGGSEGGGEPAETAKNGEIYVLYTSDVHCAIDQGFGYAGLKQVRDSLEAKGYETILADNGDAIQGEVTGTLSKGEDIIKLMNASGYDVAIPGNHEFDYGMERFLELAGMAEFKYVSANFNHQGELVFEPFVILERAGIKIAFVGVTTPATLTSSVPRNFQNESGEFVYGFMQDETGEQLYEAVQNAVDAARAEGADLVYLLGHMGYYAASSPYSYADVLENTNGIDVMLDGHSHDTEQVEMKNKDGDTVTRSACGTKFGCIGYSHISSEGEVLETGIWTWLNDVSVPGLFGLDNEMVPAVSDVRRAVEEQLGEVVATSNVVLTINDPEAVDESGKPIRMIRRAETNLGDFCADAILAASGADIALIGGGGIRVSIDKGPVTYENIINVHPYGNQISVVRASGRQILDALEWSAHRIPEEFGGFLQVAGISFDIDVSVPSGCRTDENGLATGIEGERRVRNVMVGGEPLDPDRYYTVAGTDYDLLNHGDGYTAFDGAELVAECVKLDNEVLIDYFTEVLGGEAGGEYADPYGSGRISIIGEN